MSRARYRCIVYKIQCILLVYRARRSKKPIHKALLGFPYCFLNTLLGRLLPIRNWPCFGKRKQCVREFHLYFQTFLRLFYSFRAPRHVALVLQKWYLLACKYLGQMLLKFRLYLRRQRPCLVGWLLKITGLVLLRILKQRGVGSEHILPLEVPLWGHFFRYNNQ